MRSPDVRLQVAIAARKLQGVDPVPILLDVLLSSSDPLIPQIVWQNLHPLLEERQLDVARRLEERRWQNLGLSAMATQAIERILDSPEADPRIVRALLASTNREEDMREALDVLAARFRQRSMPTAIKKALHTEFTHLLDTMDPSSVDTPVALDYRIMLAYCGDQASLKKLWEIARTNWKGADPESQADWEELRMRAVEALLSRRIQGSIRLLVASILGRGRLGELGRLSRQGPRRARRLRRPRGGADRAQSLWQSTGFAETPRRRAPDPTTRLDQGFTGRRRR